MVNEEKQKAESRKQKAESRKQKADEMMSAGSQHSPSILKGCPKGGVVYIKL
jgi:hypothetical protein